MNPPPQSATGRLLARLGALLHKAEDGILVGLLILLIVMAVLQIVLRNLLGTGIFWADAMLRVMVLWIGLIGAMAASRMDNHISLDVVTRFLPRHIRYVTSLVIRIFTSAICFTVAWYGFRFVHMEMQFGGMAFAKVPVWICVAIIPIAFLVIALRYLLLVFSTPTDSKTPVIR